MAYHFDSEPQKLSEEERQEPYLVLSKFYEGEGLAGIRLMLKSWFRAGMAGIHFENPDEKEKDRLFKFFEQVEKLVEAADIINRRSNQLEL